MQELKKSERIAPVMVVGFLWVAIIFSGLAWAGSLEPSAPPGPTMLTLDQLRLDCPADPANKTNLLFQFITNINGFDTGIVISNTGLDPFGTVGQSGGCTFHFYGSGAPSPVASGTIVPGTTYANTASTVAPGFQGYMIAVCNFSYAHGYAFVSDVGARNLAAAYTPLTICTNRSASHVERLLP